MINNPPNPSSPNDEANHKRTRRARITEDVFILLCIISLWPVVLGWQETVYQYVLYAALAGLVFIFVRRINRFRAAERELDQSNTDQLE